MKAHTIFQFLFGFSGRMTRKPFWIAFMANQILVVALVLLLSNAASSDFRLVYWEKKQWITIVETIVLSIIVLAVILNELALVSRRLHDTGRSLGAYIGICSLGSICSFIPFLGRIISLGLFIWIFVMLCQPTDYDDDTYGPAPLQKNVEETPLIVNDQDSQEEYNCTHLNGILLEPCDDEDDQLLFEEKESEWTLD